MKKIVALLLLAICFPVHIYSQNLFREGYIETKSGVLLNGMIEYKADKKIPGKCVFKRFDIATIISYSADEIKVFGYKNGNRYESLNIKNKQSFYEVLVSGKVTLYTNGSEYFVDKDQTGLVRLGKKPEALNSDSKKEFENLHSFLMDLTEGKAGQIDSKFDIKKNLVPLILKYNQLSGEDYYLVERSFSEKQLAKETRLSGANINRFGILTGLNMYNQNCRLYGSVFPVGMNDYTPDSDFEIGSVFGVSYERNLLRKSDRLSAHLELYYTSQNFYCYNETQTVTFNRRESFFDFTSVKAPVLIQYSITGKRFVPFFNGGIAYQHFLSWNYRHIDEKENSFHEISTYEDSNLKIKKSEISFVAGAGTRFRLLNNINLNLQTRVEYGTGLFVNDFSEYTLGVPSYKKPYRENSIQLNILVGITF